MGAALGIPYFELVSDFVLRICLGFRIRLFPRWRWPAGGGNLAACRAGPVLVRPRIGPALKERLSMKQAKKVLIMLGGMYHPV